MDVKFEWDENKRRANITKHGFDFEGVQTVFDGVTLTVKDDRFEYDEIRYITLGFWNGRLVHIVHTETEEVIRIISVRKATRYEEKEFVRHVGDELGAD